MFVCMPGCGGAGRWPAPPDTCHARTAWLPAGGRHYLDVHAPPGCRPAAGTTLIYVHFFVGGALPGGTAFIGGRMFGCIPGSGSAGRWPAPPDTCHAWTAWLPASGRHYPDVHGPLGCRPAAGPTLIYVHFFVGGALPDGTAFIGGGMFGCMPGSGSAGRWPAPPDTCHARTAWLPASGRHYPGVHGPPGCRPAAGTTLMCVHRLVAGQRPAVPLSAAALRRRRRPRSPATATASARRRNDGGHARPARVGRG